MNDAAVPSSHADCIARAKRCAAILKAAGDRIEAAREVPKDVMDALHAERLFRMSLPRSLGGDEASLVSLTEVTEIVAAADGSAAWCFGQGSGCGTSAAMLTPAAARQVFGPADAILAWGAGAQGKAHPVAGGYRISGRWSFASGSRAATWIGAHCRMFDADGRPVLRDDGRQLENTFLVPRDKAGMIDDWDTMGLRGTGSDSYWIDGMIVPAHLGFDREYVAAGHAAATLYRFPQIMIYAGAFAGVMLGIARGMLDDLKALAMTKTPRGAASSLRDSAVFHSQYAQMEARLRATRAYHLGTLRRVWDDVDTGRPLTASHRHDMRLSSTYAINEALEIALDAYRSAGATAIFPANGFERRARDALSASQQVQGRPAHFTTVGRHLMGLDPDTPMFV